MNWGGAGVWLLSSFMRKKKKNPWELREQNEGKETTDFVRPFYLLMLPALFLSMLNPVLNCFGFAFEFFPNWNPLIFLSSPKWLMYCFCLLLCLHHQEIQSKRPDGALPCRECLSTPTQLYKDS